MAKKKTAKKASAGKKVKRPATRKAAKAGAKKPAAKKKAAKKVAKKTAAKKVAASAKVKAGGKKSKASVAAAKPSKKKATSAAGAKRSATAKSAAKKKKSAGAKRSAPTSKESKKTKAAAQTPTPKRTGKPRFTQKTSLSQGRRTSAKLTRPVVPFRPAAEADAGDREPLTVAQLRKVKTGLTKRDLDHFYRQLLDRRAVIAGDVDTMQLDARNGDGTLSHVPVHMADIGSDNYEQEFTLGLVESERKLLMEIDAAIERIRDRIYGVCIERGIPIGRARLDAKPWAKYCIEEARERERRQNR